jgi:hypothetical protein
MFQILAEASVEAIKELGGIGVSVGKSVKNELLFPSKPQNLEDQISSQIRAKNSTIRTQGYNLSSAQGNLREKDNHLRNYQEALEQKDRVIRTLQKRIRSLEILLQNSRSRPKYRR